MEVITIMMPVFFMLGLGMFCRMRGLITPQEKAGANAIVFQILFPIMIFNLMMTVKVDTSSLAIVGYVLAVFLLALAVGKLTVSFTGQKYAGFSWLLMTTTEGGNVALPLYLSIVGTSSNTVVFDIAGSIMAFIVTPIVVARILSSGVSKKEMIKNIVSNSFVLAVALGLFMNLSGLYQVLQTSAFFEMYTATVDRATSPIIGIILFILGYDMKVDREMIGALVKLSLVRVLYYAAVIGGFFLLFAEKMQNPEFMMAVLIYFMCPTGFGLLPVVQPLFKSDEDEKFTSAFMSTYILITLVVYALTVIFIA